MNTVLSTQADLREDLFTVLKFLGYADQTAADVSPHSVLGSFVFGDPFQTHA